MSFIRAQVSLAADTSVPSDACQNVWHFNSGGTLDAGLADDITDYLETFYGSLGDFWASSLTGGGSIKFYDLADPEPRPPVATTSFTFPVETDSLPAEAAVCMSFHGVIDAGFSPARRKGRLYLGPCAKGVCAIVDDAARVAGTFTANIASAAEALLATAGGAGVVWSVFSQTQATESGSLGAGFYSVTGGHIDNAFDTQRRRGPEASLRVTFAP